MQTKLRWTTSLCALLALPAAGVAADNLIGFDAAGSSAELSVEKQLDASIGTDEVSERVHKALASRGED